MVESGVELSARKCKPCEGGTPLMDEKEVKAMLEKVDGWEWRENTIRKGFKFKAFRERAREGVAI